MIILLVAIKLQGTDILKQPATFSFKLSGKMRIMGTKNVAKGEAIIDKSILTNSK